MDTATRQVVDRFNEAFNAHDVDGVMDLMTDDCVFESTAPSPDGGRFEGAHQVRKVWEELSAQTPNAKFEWEEVFDAGDRAVVRWRFIFDAKAPESGHVRGVDLMRIKDGKVSEKLSYVKG